MTEHEETDQKRRNVLKALAAAGIGGAGLAGASGSAAAQQGGGQGGGGLRRLRFDLDEIDEFDGQLTLTDLEVAENADGDLELLASGRLRGQVVETGERVNETFEDLVLGLLEQILGILQPDEPGECPILTLDVGKIFLDLLGLQVETSEIQIDITAVAGPGNLLGNLLCAVAGLLDP